MELRMWERIVLVGGAIAIMGYVFGNVIWYEFNQTAAINNLFQKNQRLERIIMPPQEKNEGG